MAEDRVIGIDLGTTNSLVAFMQGEQPVVIPGEDGSALVPSVVAIPPAGDAAAGSQKVIVGNGAAKYLATSPDRVVYSAKRLMGRGLEDVQEELKLFPFHLAEDIQPGEVLRLRVGESEYTPSEISAFVLRQLKRNAERYFAASSHEGGHHRPRLLQRRAAPGHQRRRPHRRPRSPAPGQRADSGSARLRPRPPARRNRRRLRPRRRNLRYLHPQAARGHLRGDGHQRRHPPRRRRHRQPAHRHCPRRH